MEARVARREPRGRLPGTHRLWSTSPWLVSALDRFRTCAEKGLHLLFRVGSGVRVRVEYFQATPFSAHVRKGSGGETAVTPYP